MVCGLDERDLDGSVQLLTLKSGAGRWTRALDMLDRAIGVREGEGERSVDLRPWPERVTNSDWHCIGPARRREENSLLTHKLLDCGAKFLSGVSSLWNGVL